MADRAERWPDNVPGRFYVDSACICCTLCVDLAPDHFRYGEHNAYTVCYVQPRTDAAEEACREALAACPVDAIGADGDRLAESQAAPGARKAL